MSIADTSASHPLRRRLGVAVLGAAVLIATSCGTSDATSSATEPAPTAPTSTVPSARPDPPSSVSPTSPPTTAAPSVPEAPTSPASRPTADLDDLVMAHNRKLDEQGTPGKESQPVQPLRLKVEATAILLFGESTADSGRFRVLVDGVAVTGKGGQEKGADWFEGNRWKTGNGFLLYEVARGLDPGVPHLLEIEPVFDSGKAQELKLESICVAGGKATVSLPQRTAE